MPFNAQSYYRNKAKREAQEYMAAARATDDPEKRARNVRLARSHWKTYLGKLKLGECDADLKRCRAGKMTYADFMEKWG